MKYRYTFQFILIFSTMLKQFVLGESIFGNRTNVCEGSSRGTGYTMSDNATHITRYESYRLHYSNCSVVLTNLEIVFLHSDESSGESFDMSFLENIEEVYGYVLIAYNHIEELPLNNLRVIHGQKLYEGHSLFVEHNVKHNSTYGLRSLQLNALREISRGNVAFIGNNQLCFINTIDWSDMMFREKSDVIIRQLNNSLTAECNESCDESCYQKYTNNRHCWGKGPNNCQKFYRHICTPNCETGCFGPNVTDCCSEECAGGCVGSKHNCWACNNFMNGDECVSSCPPPVIYNQHTFKYEPNPDMKFAYKNMCIDKCKAHMFVLGGACVASCGEGYRPKAEEGNKCVPCGEACPKNCSGGVVTGKNVESFINCTIVEGGLKILSHVFDDPIEDYALRVEQLDYLKTIEEVTDCVQLEGSLGGVTSLYFLQNLKRILGHHQCGTPKFAMRIIGTQLRTIGLSALEEVANGHVLIANNENLTELGLVSLNSIPGRTYMVNNPKLCYIRDINWDRFGEKLVKSGNADADYCEMNNHTCSEQCKDGCWGAGDESCVDCASYRLDRLCLSSCDSLPGLFVRQTESDQCGSCHAECLHNCSGEEADKCLQCRHMKDGPYCVESCPPSKYPDENNICQPCYSECDGGCSGPGKHYGRGGCRSCFKYLENGYSFECFPHEATCPRGFYDYRIPHPDLFLSESQSVRACLKCHPECETCLNPGPMCPKCRHFSQGGVCVANCSSDTYPQDSTGTCLQCHEQCLQCSGLTDYDCLICRNFRVYDVLRDNFIAGNGSDLIPNNDGIYNGTKNSSMLPPKPLSYCDVLCPDWAPFRVTQIVYINITELVCSSEPEIGHQQNQMSDRGVNLKLLGSGLAVLLVVLIVGFVSSVLYSRQKKLKRKRKLEILGMEQLEVSSPSQFKPDQSLLRIINESELHCGPVIGSGAFGTVYKAVWTPSGEKIKIPVAVKVLQKESTGPEASSELLEEARIMATVRHRNCIRILGISLTAEPKLVTQLMPLGSLLDYIQRYSHKIGSNALLTWSKQIAEGMNYLESVGIVHRDLAARNVLVEEPMVVRITDFGLAKLMHDKEEYLATGGRVPIKWLALESIQHRIFTHKSDVWSYGVTLWELFTYGKKPYEGISARGLCDVLERGERLPQPAILTIDVYMIMIKCWMVDAQSRPTFAELAEAFTEFALDPGRYVVIKGDECMSLPSPVDNLSELMMGDLQGLAGVSGELVCAEDYLRPHDLLIDELAQLNRQSGYTNSSYHNEINQPEESPTSGGRSMEALAEVRKACLNNEHCRKQSFRYLPNPSTKSTSSASGKKRGNDMAEAKSRLEYVNSNKMCTDEEDYLQPRSSINRPNYLDLLPANTTDDDGDDVNKKEKNDQLRDLIAWDNPEYFVSSKKTKVGNSLV